MPKTKSPRVPKGSRVRIRMYRQGIGDCHLLTFYGGDEPRHILIDCGVLSGTPGGKDKILRVAQSIKEATGDRLEALVVTHEHWDHVSGFNDARNIFDPMKSRKSGWPGPRTLVIRWPKT